MAHVDRMKIRIFYDEEAELWFLTYVGLPSDTIISYSSNYEFLEKMSVWAVGQYLDNLKISYEQTMENLLKF